DSEVKPRDTFATIIRCAIMGAPHKRMTLAAIYTAIEAKYPYYRDAGPGWKNTVRHVLSTSQQFEKSRRPITEPGKGGYWSVNLTVTPKGENPRQRKS
ncbi:winged helix DNA-binding domain-containing protein, partial [Sistotremastrum niveocremeum HHB9708]